MTAICPAGPPKLMNPSLSQKLTATRNEGVGGRSVAVEDADEVVKQPPSRGV
jgi:hypothetical protein